MRPNKKSIIFRAGRIIKKILLLPLDSDSCPLLLRRLERNRNVKRRLTFHASHRIASLLPVWTKAVDQVVPLKWRRWWWWWWALLSGSLMTAGRARVLIKFNNCASGMRSRIVICFFFAFLRKLTTTSDTKTRHKKHAVETQISSRLLANAAYQY